MSSRISRLGDLASLARQAEYRPQALANLCTVSLRQLERYSRAVYRQTPLAWLRTLRFQEAKALLARGETVKATAYALGYRQISHFSREFKRQIGVRPTDFVPERPGVPSANWLPAADNDTKAPCVGDGASEHAEGLVPQPQSPPQPTVT